MPRAALIFMKLTSFGRLHLSIFLLRVPTFSTLGKMQIQFSEWAGPLIEANCCRQAKGLLTYNTAKRLDCLQSYLFGGLSGGSPKIINKLVSYQGREVDMTQPIRNGLPTLSKARHPTRALSQI